MRWLIPTGSVAGTVTLLVLFPLPVGLTLGLVGLFALWFNWGRLIDRLECWADGVDYANRHGQLDRLRVDAELRMLRRANEYQQGRLPRGRW